MKKDKKYWVLDAETLPNCFILCVEDAHNDKKFHFTLWKNKNDLTKLYQFLHFCINMCHIHVTFNGLAFDSQILHWLLLNEERLLKQDTDSVIDGIYKKAQECIDKSFLENEFPEYPEWKLEIPQIDIYKQQHWNSSSRLCSLKWLQCSMDWPNIQDMPYHHTHYVQNEAELEEITGYCYNDVSATKKGFHLCKEGTELRETLSREYNLRLNSASEPKLAKELFMYSLVKRLGMPRQEIKKWSTRRDTIDVGKLLLPYVTFERQEFTMLMNNFRKLVIVGTTLRKAFKYKIPYRGLHLTYGVGGLHGDSGAAKHFSDENNIIIDLDAKSYYPNLAIKNKWSPAHINKQIFCELYEAFYIERQKFKKGSAKNYLYKITLNSIFGLSIEPNSFLSDPALGISITVNGQLLLSMLIEMICEGIPEAKPLVANTDGVSILIPRSQEARYYEICKKWEEVTKLELEFENIKKMFAFDANNFISVGEKTIKCKGRFEFEPHDKYDTNVLHKNKSFLVVAKGIYEYFVNGADPDVYVRSHRKIYDFCGFARAKGKWQFIQRSASLEGVLEKPIQKTLRYYVSNLGSRVIKRNTEDQREIQVLAGRYYIIEFNKYQEKEWEEYALDYKYYVKEIWREIKLLEKEQLQLF